MAFKMLAVWFCYIYCDTNYIFEHSFIYIVSTPEATKVICRFYLRFGEKSDKMGGVESDIKSRIP